MIDAIPFDSAKNASLSLSEREKTFVLIKRGEPICATLQKTDLEVSVKAWPSGLLGNANYIYPNNINLITLPDNQGQSKVAILDKAR